MNDLTLLELIRDDEEQLRSTPVRQWSRPVRDTNDVAGVARRTDPETSRAAAAAIGAGVELEVQRIHSTRGGLTDDELVALLPDLFGPTVKSARSRLTGAGVLVDSGVRRPSLRGRDQIVWAVA